MPRKRKPYAPVTEVLPDGSTMVRTGIYREVRRPPFKTFAEFQTYFKQCHVPKQSPAEVLAAIEQLARDLLAPHISPEPMTPVETLAAKAKIKGNLPPGEVRSTTIVADDRGGKIQHYKVKTESQCLPIIAAASAVLTYIRRIRKSGRESFLAGLELGQLVERMFLRAAEPEFIAVARLEKSRPNAKVKRRAGSRERNARIAQAVDAGIRQGRKRERVYQSVGEAEQLSERRVRDIFRLHHPEAF